MKNLLNQGLQAEKVEMAEDKRLKMDVQMFLRRKDEVVKLYDALKIFAAAIGVELKFVFMLKVGLVFMLVAQTMRTQFCRFAETTRQAMVFGAIVEAHVPTHGDEEHHKSHHQGTNLQDSFFHAAKVRKKQMKYSTVGYFFRCQVCERPNKPALSNEPRRMSSSVLA